MGKGNIIEGGTSGYYNVTSILNPDRIVSELADLDAKLIIYEEKIAAASEGLQKNVLKAMLFGLQRRKVQVETHRVETEALGGVWCADLTENITGDVGLIEVPGESVSYNIQPGYEGNAAYDAVRDGQLIQTMFVSPEAAFYNIAMLPGWQKWKPTFRYGTITAISGSTADVTLEAALSTQQDLNINQTDTLEDVPFSYMTCDEDAFVVDDVVLIKFENQEWATPKIVGFKDNPKACGFYILVTSGIHATVFDITNDAVATDVLKNNGDLAIFPCLAADISDFILYREAFGTGCLTSLPGPEFNLPAATENHLENYVRQFNHNPATTDLYPNPTPLELPGVNYLGSPGVEDLGALIVSISSVYYPEAAQEKEISYTQSRSVPEKNRVPLFVQYPVYGKFTRDFQNFPIKLTSVTITSLTNQTTAKQRSLEAGFDIDFENRTIYLEGFPVGDEDLVEFHANFDQYANSETQWTIKIPFAHEVIDLIPVISHTNYSMPDALSLPYWLTTTELNQIKQKRPVYVETLYSEDTKSPFMATLCVMSYETSNLAVTEYTRSVFSEYPYHDPYYDAYMDLDETNVQKLNYVRAFIDETTEGTYMDTDIYDMTPNNNLKAAVEDLCDTDNTGDIQMKFIK